MAHFPVAEATLTCGFTLFLSCFRPEFNLKAKEYLADNDDVQPRLSGMIRATKPRRAVGQRGALLEPKEFLILAGLSLWIETPGLFHEFPSHSKMAVKRPAAMSARRITSKTNAMRELRV